MVSVGSGFRRVTPLCPTGAPRFLSVFSREVDFALNPCFEDGTCGPSKNLRRFSSRSFSFSNSVILLSFFLSSSLRPSISLRSFSASSSFIADHNVGSFSYVFPCAVHFGACAKVGDLLLEETNDFLFEQKSPFVDEDALHDYLICINIY